MSLTACRTETSLLSWHITIKNPFNVCNHNVNLLPAVTLQHSAFCPQLVFVSFDDRNKFRAFLSVVLKQCLQSSVNWFVTSSLTLNIPSLARQRCLPSWGPRRTPWFFCNFSTVWFGRLLKLCFLGFWNYNSVIQTLLASNILCLFISTEVTGDTELFHTHSSLIQHLNNVIFENCRWAIFQIYNVQNIKITIIITTFRICNVVYQAGSRWDPKCVFNFLRFFERTLYKSNFITFILSWCGTHTKIRNKLVDIVTAGSQKITLWGPQRTPLGILRVKWN